MWRADCSRVTHPFAARVPRRALPLDLHVLSTPPAFVLSQDQTLQQKPLEENKPSPDKTSKKQTQRNPNPNKGARGQSTPNVSTLLSSQRTTTRTANHPRRRPHHPVPSDAHPTRTTAGQPFQ